VAMPLNEAKALDKNERMKELLRGKFKIRFGPKVP